MVGEIGVREVEDPVRGDWLKCTEERQGIRGALRARGLLEDEEINVLWSVFFLFLYQCGGNTCVPQFAHVCEG